MKFAFIAKHRAVWPVAWMCAALGVSRSGFHAWLTRQPSQRARDDEAILSKVRASFVAKPAPDSTRTGAVGTGWVSAPTDPTEEMIAAGWIDKEDVDPDDIYRAMIAARPAAPEAQGTCIEDTDDERANALRNCAEAVVFFDQVKASSSAEQAAVGVDHWNWLEAACRRAGKAAPPSSGQGGR